MAAKDMTDALHNPHPEFPFTSVGDDTIAALTDLAEISKLKIQQTPSPQHKLRLPRPYNAQASLHHRPKSGTRPCPSSDKRDHRRQLTPNISPICHYLRGWSHLGHYVNHPRGCPPAPSASHPATCLRTTSAAWTPPTWQSPSDITIGHSSTTPTQSSTQSPEKKCNTRPS
jgi:hypothetical protein